MSSAPLPPETDCRTVADKLKTSQSFVLIDCREKDEYDTVHIDGAVLLPMSELQARVGELEAYRDHEIAIHCHHGGRSLRVSNWLRANGYPQAQSVAGGIDQWAMEIEPGMRRY